MFFNKEIITIFNTNKEKYEQYKSFLSNINENDFLKITIIIENNLPSNEYGPAIIVETKDEIIKSWLYKGIYHRLYGPAIEYKFHNGNNKWIINGMLINTQSMNDWINENEIIENYKEWSTYEKGLFLIKWYK